jgi:acylphosphatase
MEKTRERARLWLKVEGRVQGVYFRASTVHEARKLGLTGWVKNRPDGSVEVIAEGERTVLEELERWCRQGPPGALVRTVERVWQEAVNEFDDFRIRR